MDNETRDENLIPPRKAQGSKIFSKDPEVAFYDFAYSIFQNGLHLPHSSLGMYKGKLFEIDRKHTKRGAEKDNVPTAPLLEGYNTYTLYSMNTDAYSLSFFKYIEDERKYLFFLNTSQGTYKNHEIRITFFEETAANKRKQEVADALGINAWSFPGEGNNKQSVQRIPEEPISITLPIRSKFPDDLYNFVQVLQNQNFGDTRLSISLPDGFSYRVSNRDGQHWKFRAPLHISGTDPTFTGELESMKCQKNEIFTPQDIRGGDKVQRRIPSHITTYHRRYDFFIDVTNCNKLLRPQCYNNMDYYESLFFELDLEAMGITEEQVSVEGDEIVIKKKVEK